MTALDALAQVVRSDVFTFIQFQGSLVLLGLGIAWMLAGLSRRRQVQRLVAAQQSAGKSAEAAARKISMRNKLPGISVVMPVKGCRTYCLSNWSSHVNVKYGGPIEFLFVVESEEDPAFAKLNAFTKQLKHLDIRVLVAGYSTNCSQKLHNMQVSGRQSDPPGAAATRRIRAAQMHHADFLLTHRLPCTHEAAPPLPAAQPRG